MNVGFHDSKADTCMFVQFNDTRVTIYLLCKLTKNINEHITNINSLKRNISHRVTIKAKLSTFLIQSSYVMVVFTLYSIIQYTFRQWMEKISRDRLYQLHQEPLRAYLKMKFCYHLHISLASATLPQLLHWNIFQIAKNQRELVILFKETAALVILFNDW